MKNLYDTSRQFLFPKEDNRWHWLTQVQMQNHHHTTTVLRPFLRDHPGELVPEENF